MADENRDAAFDAAVRADALRAEALKGLATVSEARRARLERERLRLAGRLGTDHPRVKALEWQVEESATRLLQIAAHAARAQTVTPRPGPGSWALYGYVRSADGQARPELTVALADARGSWIRNLGFACTDARGYFELVIAFDARATDQPQAQGYIRVTDASRAVLHRDQQPVTAVPGELEYREIVLGGGGVAACASPEEEADAPAPKPSEPADTFGPADKKPPSGRRAARRRDGR